MQTYHCRAYNKNDNEWRYFIRNSDKLSMKFGDILKDFDVIHLGMPFFDSNKQQIFEGDIVKVDFYSAFFSGDIIGLVMAIQYVFAEEVFFRNDIKKTGMKWVITNKNGIYNIFDGGAPFSKDNQLKLNKNIKKIEVIGNAIDNQELFKKFDYMQTFEVLKTSKRLRG